MPDFPFTDTDKREHVVARVADLAVWYIDSRSDEWAVGGKIPLLQGALIERSGLLQPVGPPAEAVDFLEQHSTFLGIIS